MMGGKGSGYKKRFGSGRPALLESEIVQGKMRRLISIMALLYQRPVTAKEIAKHIDCSDRTAHRLLNTIQASGLEVESTMDFKYFLVKYDKCPICGSHQQLLTKTA